MRQKEKDISSKITLIGGCVDEIQNLLHAFEAKELLNNQPSPCATNEELKSDEEIEIPLQPEGAAPQSPPEKKTE